MKTAINEKTLELNVISSLLKSIRKNFPKAYSIGFDLKQELHGGLDSSIDISRTFRFLSFQFKKPYRVEKNVYWFHFNNNKHKNQHNTLCSVRLRTNSVIFYALPLYENLDKLHKDSPNFLKRTYLIDPLNVGGLPDKSIHRFEINVKSKIVDIHSDFKKQVKAKSMDEIIHSFIENKIGNTNKEFKNKIKDRVDKENDFFKNIPILEDRYDYRFNSKIMLKGIAVESKKSSNFS